MGYEPTIWQDGDTITSVRLNKLEQGVATLSNESLGAMTFVGTMGSDGVSIYASTTPYDITSGETISDINTSIYNDTDVFIASIDSINMPSGCYVMVQASVPTDWTTDSLTVYDANGEQQITSGFECKMASETYYASAFFTMQVPADGLSVSFGDGGIG